MVWVNLSCSGGLGGGLYQGGQDDNDEDEVPFTWFVMIWFFTLAQADWEEGYIRDCNGKSNGGSLQIGFESSESIAGDGLLIIITLPM